ncbi:TylF/MycF/NovP-related O-methyltransferase [Bacteroidota bacterium]
MSNDFILEILENSSMMTIEQGMNIYHLLSKVISHNIPGSVVELGCFNGLSAALLQKTLDEHNSVKELHLFDSFEGLPDKTELDGPTGFQKGSCKSSKEEVIKNFQKFSLKIPNIHVGWFNKTLPTQLPEKICFAHLDGDFYSSIMESLENVYPRLSKGAIVIVDDYYDPDINIGIQNKLNSNTMNKNSSRTYVVRNFLPGVKNACDNFFKDKPEQMQVLVSGEEAHGYFIKS